MINERQVRSGKGEQGRPWQKWRVEIERSPGANFDTLAARDTLKETWRFLVEGLVSTAVEEQTLTEWLKVNVLLKNNTKTHNLHESNAQLTLQILFQKLKH